ncbi:MAG: hypothetical protein NTV86_03955 [Planctomycetota bacterium]|nr:hypothetical protein [Planctomycetota bacterium]
MSGKRAKRLRAETKRAQGSVCSNRVKKPLWFGLFVGLTSLVAGGYLVAFHNKPPKPSPPYSYPALSRTREVKSLDDLLKMTPEQLDGVDIAERNLLCATGLPGAESLDVDKALARLNEWAARVRYWTEQSLWDFRQNPDKFKNSQAKFRVLLLISVVQKDFGVHYNDRGQRNCDFSNAKNAFLHGMIDDANGGTCASMPVMYVAVGRRLGYPMKLVLAKTHVFARWDDGPGGERFNIEGTNPRFDDHPDSYYRTWPAPISDAELKQGWYLKPLTAAEELAVFLQNRACCLMDNDRYAEARSAFVHAYRLAPQNPLGQAQIASASNVSGPVYAVPVASARRIHGPGTVDEFGARMVYPNPWDDIERINAINRTNMPRSTPPPGGVSPHRPPQPPTLYGPTNADAPPAYQPVRP